mgnify:FL=1
MPEFNYSDLLPVGKDETEYRLITTEGVSTFQAEGMEFLKVAPAALEKLTSEAIHDINHYNFYLALFFSYLWISGAYFPIGSLPGWVQWMAWAVPITSVVDALRELMIGRFTPRFFLEITYIFASFLFLAELAMRGLRRRMIG